MSWQHPKDRPRKAAYDRAYYLAHRDAKRAAAARWAHENVEVAKRNVKRWRAENHERVAAGKRTAKAQRRATIRGSTGTHTTKDWTEKLDLFGGCCFYCGEARPMTRDHKVPLSRGGSNAIDNIVPACLPCNLRKGTKMAREFLAA